VNDGSVIMVCDGLSDADFSVQVIVSSEGITEHTHTHTHGLSSVSRSSSALQTFITPVGRCETRMTKLKSQVHEANRPFAAVIKKKEDYIACHSVMVSLRFFAFLQSLIAV